MYSTNSIPLILAKTYITPPQANTRAKSTNIPLNVTSAPLLWWQSRWHPVTLTDTWDDRTPHIAWRQLFPLNLMVLLMTFPGYVHKCNAMVFNGEGCGYRVGLHHSRHRPPTLHTRQRQPNHATTPPPSHNRDNLCDKQLMSWFTSKTGKHFKTHACQQYLVCTQWVWTSWVTNTRNSFLLQTRTKHVRMQSNQKTLFNLWHFQIKFPPI